MSSISQTMRERLLGQKNALGRAGIEIDNKTFVKDRLRLLPICGHESIGIAHTSIFFPGLNKYVVSPITFGIPCPILDAVERIKATGVKEDIEFAKNCANISTEYWCGVISRKDMGTAANPKIRILRAKSTVFDTLLTWMVDEDVGEDITAVKDGRDFLLKKTGVKKDTKWTCEKFDREPLSDDPEYNDAVVRLATVFDPRNHFKKLDLDALKEGYEALTGEAMPASYEASINEHLEKSEAGAKHQKPAEKRATPTPSFARPAHKPAPAPAPEETEATDSQESDDAGAGASLESPADGPEQDPNFPIGTRVVWTEGDASIKGMVVGMDADPNYAGCILVRADGDGEDTPPWSLPASDLTVEEVKPSVTRRRPAPAAPAKSEPSQVATETPPQKSAPRIQKPASAGIRDRLIKK